MFQRKTILKAIAVGTVFTALSACAHIHDNRPQTAQKYREARQGANPGKLIVNERRPNDFAVYFGRKAGSAPAPKKPKKGKKHQAAAAPRGNIVTAGNDSYETESTTLDRSDIRMVFVSRTNDGKPAFAMRLQPQGVSKLNQAQNNGYREVLASMNGVVFSRVHGSEAKLADGVLMMPMPTLSSARDAADAVRSPVLR